MHRLTRHVKLVVTLLQAHVLELTCTVDALSCGKVADPKSMGTQAQSLLVGGQLSNGRVIMNEGALLFICQK
jgi:hypothetical protein